MLDPFMIHSKPFYNLTLPELPLAPKKIVYFFFVAHQEKFFIRVVRVFFLSSHTCIYLVTHLVQIGTHRGEGCVLTGRFHLVCWHIGNHVTVFPERYVTPMLIRQSNYIANSRSTVQVRLVAS